MKNTILEKMNQETTSSNAVILNPNQEILIFKFIKKIFNKVNEKEYAAKPVFPSFIFLECSEFQGKSPAEIKKIIKEAELFPCVIKDGQIFFPVKFILKDGKTAEEKLVAAEIRSERLKDTASLSIEQKEFPMQLKIFRIAQVKQKIHTAEVWNDVWCKLK